MFHTNIIVHNTITNHNFFFKFIFKGGSLYGYDVPGLNFDPSSGLKQETSPYIFIYS